MELYALYKSGRYLQEQETVDTYSGGKENFPLNPSDPNKNDLWWVWPCRQRLHSVLGQVADMGYAKPPVTQAQSQLSAMRGLAGSIAQLNLNPLSREEIVRANLSRNPKLLDEMIDFVHTSMSGPGERYDPFLRLVIDLLDKEDTFESKLAVEHVEDKLINKQVSFFDVDNLAMNISGDPSTYFSWLVNPQGRTAFNDVLENKIYKIIEEASLVNRTRRNFRLLRDWQDRRPWTQIIQLWRLQRTYLSAEKK
ncbi:hypothetical protein N431DRAFT_135039 [Stipitochalara longipes BDJ]|nr:hypothetical protein N431DRAFT_135039 [Stipitochalara longipes BDJ]